MQETTKYLNGREGEGDTLTAQSRKTDHPRIVMVNDERWLLELLDVAIRSCFKDVTALRFDNGADALEELSRTTPDLLITDDIMPFMSGVELCQRLLDKKVTYPIIMTSSFSPTEQEVQELAQGGLNVSYLSCPCTVTELRRQIETSSKITIKSDVTQQPVATEAQPARPRKTNSNAPGKSDSSLGKPE